MQHKVFISYHHGNDQRDKEKLIKLNDEHEIFIDRSVDTGDIDENLPPEKIREKIRDEYLRDSTVTIVLLGKETMKRKHVDWELYSSMIDGTINKKSGILIVCLESIRPHYKITVSHEGELKLYQPTTANWVPGPQTVAECKRRHPFASMRMIRNILKPEALISVTDWKTIQEPHKLRTLIELTFKDRHNCKYDFTEPMMSYNRS